MGWGEGERDGAALCCGFTQAVAAAGASKQAYASGIKLSRKHRKHAVSSGQHPHLAAVPGVCQLQVAVAPLHQAAQLVRVLPKRQRRQRPLEFKLTGEARAMRAHGAR